MLETKNLKKMSRKELLELLVFVSKKNDELQKELDETKEQLNNKQINIKESGSIAEAALKLNNIFETAQKAANQYLENIKRIEKSKSASFKIRKNSSNIVNKNK